MGCIEPTLDLRTPICQAYGRLLTHMSRLLRLLTIIALIACVAECCAAQSSTGTEACAGCHQKIYDSYSKTPMANASGPAIKEIIPGEFRHAKSGVVYRIYEQDGKAWLSFERPGDVSVRGAREPLYYIGSTAPAAVTCSQPMPFSSSHL